MFKSLFQMAKRLIKGYSYTKNEHCNDPKLLELVENFKQERFNKVEETLLSFNADYREFGFKSIGEVEDISIVEKWINQHPDNITAKLVLAYHKIAQGWIIRGVGSINSVEEENLLKFKKLLQEAKEILLNIEDNSSEFDINKNICLLTLFKAIDLEDRTIIHQTFQHGLSIDSQHIGLHIAYFTAISEKWGGTREELNTYFEQIPSEPALLSQCIQSMYYWDLIKIYRIDDEATESKIKDFIMQIDRQGIPKDNLYRYELYLRLYWLSSVLIDGLKDKYYQLVKPYWDDK